MMKKQSAQLLTGCVSLSLACNFIIVKFNIVLCPGFSLGLDDMEGTSTGGQSSNRGGRMGRDIYFMGGPILRIVFNPKR